MKGPQMYITFLRDRKGSAILEFALGASLLSAVFAGTFQFGYSFYQYNLLKNAVNEGAHYAALRTYDSSSSTPSTAFSSAVSNMVVYGNPAGGSIPVVSGLSPSNVNLVVNFALGVPSSMQVFVSGYTINAVFTSMSLSNKPSAAYPYEGVYAPY